MNSDLTITQIPLADLHLFDENPRTPITEEKLRSLNRSLEELGLFKPLLVFTGFPEARGDHVVIGGNKRLTVLRWRLEAGLDVPETIPCLLFPGPEWKARMVVLRDNTQEGEWDYSLLPGFLDSLRPLLPDGQDLGLSGFTHDQLEELEALVGPDVGDDGDGGDGSGAGAAGGPSEGDIGEDVELRPADVCRERWETAPGQIWRVGPHILMCGDSRSPEDFALLMAADVAAGDLAPVKAEAMWTDPPYGVSYVGKAGAIENDGAVGLPALLNTVFLRCQDYLRPGAPVYIAHPAGDKAPVFIQAILNVGWIYRQGLVWYKGEMVLGHSDYHYDHEPIIYGFTPGGSGVLGRGGPHWHGDNAQRTVVTCPKPRSSELHPTMKPPELIRGHLRNSAGPGDLVLEPFIGSGSTAVACLQLGLRCRGMELDPAYFAAALDRLVRMGCKATKIWERG